MLEQGYILPLFSPHTFLLGNKKPPLMEKLWLSVWYWSNLSPRGLYNKVILLSNYRAAIRAIGSDEVPIFKTIVECQILLERLRADGRLIVFQWIPGHYDIFGNEQADMLAKKGMKIVQQSTTSN